MFLISADKENTQGFAFSALLMGKILYLPHSCTIMQSCFPNKFKEDILDWQLK